jgi:hypothetical protein
MTLGTSEERSCRAGVNYTQIDMAKTAPKSKSAMESLVDSFSDLVADAKKRMSPDEFRQAEKDSTRLSIRSEPALLAVGVVKPRNPNL